MRSSNNSSSSGEGYKRLRGEIARMREQAKAVMRQAFEAGAKTLFAAHPDLHVLCLRAYTPYFNDGDVCTYRVNWDINNQDYDDGKDDVKYPNIDWDSPARKAVDAFVDAFAEEDIQSVFGDHKKITLRRDGRVEVEDYEHD